MRRSIAPLSTNSVALLLALLGALCACDDESLPRYQLSCERNCARAHECSSTVDEVECSAQCKANLADVGPQLSPDYLDEVETCVSMLPCDQLALASVLDACPREAQATVSPSRAAQDLCDSVVSSFEECLGVRANAVGCLESSKILSDTALRKALRCENKPCDMRASCMQDALGSDVTPQGRRSIRLP